MAVGAGAINTFKVADSGREIALFHVGDGRMSPVNIISVLFDRPAIASARVDTAVEAVLIPSSIVRAWVATIDPIRIALMETMATGLAELMSLVEVVAFQTIDNRLTDLLVRRFAERCVIFATHEKIAAELGTTREVVSRLLKRYERAGTIRIARSRLELIDTSILHRLAFSLENVGRHSASHGRRAWRGGQQDTCALGVSRAPRVGQSESGPACVPAVTDVHGPRRLRCDAKYFSAAPAARRPYDCEARVQIDNGKAGVK